MTRAGKVLEDGLAHSVRDINAALQKEDHYDFLEATAALDGTVEQVGSWLCDKKVAPPPAAPPLLPHSSPSGCSSCP